MSSEAEHLYFHSPCFDGIISAVLAWDFLEARKGWKPIIPHGVNYELRDNWLLSSLERPCAVVDFLYHPQADFWADHHITAFLGEEAENHYKSRKNENLIYDANAGSCSGLLWTYFAHTFNYRNFRHTELVEWAEKIDSARYTSVSEAIISTEPALRINLGLPLADPQKDCEDLVRALRVKSLKEVAEYPAVQERFERASSLIRKGLERFSKSATLSSDGIVTFNVDNKGVAISRYAPYHFYPKARYSVGLVRSQHSGKILAMRNPWLEFESVFLGEICAKFGGGGHQRVGAIALNQDRLKDASSIVDKIVSEIRKEEFIAKKSHLHDRTFKFL